MSWSLAVFVGLAVLTASSGAIFTPGEWYRGLRKPSWNPPDWAFAPAWTVLYIMIAVSGWMVWRQAGSVGAAAFPLAVYLVQLLFNAGWSAVFFGLKRPDLAFVEVVGLWLSILIALALVARVRRSAALLLLPYLGWLCFAGALNYQFIAANPDGGPQDASGAATRVEF